MMNFDRLPWLKDLIAGINCRGGLICYHGRQLSMCGVCAPEAERLHKEWKEKNEPTALSE